MKSAYKQLEDIFETLTKVALKIFGSSITFLVAVLIVIVYFSTAPIRIKSLHDSIYNIILAFTFLGFFIIQKAFNKFSAALNLKMNELLSAHENASNRLVDIENKSEAELLELSAYYSKMAASVKSSGTDTGAKSIEELMPDPLHVKTDRGDHR